MSNLKVIATYPRSKSAWLSNFLTIPNKSMYVHDALAFPRLMDHIQETNYPHRGIVAPAAKESLIPEGSEIIVIDDDFDRVLKSVNAWLGSDAIANLKKTQEELGKLKLQATHVYDMANIEDWIDLLFEYCTGEEYDELYFKSLSEFYIEGMLARKGGNVVRQVMERIDPKTP